MRANFKVRAFFDSPKVIAATTEAERKVLSKAGAFVQRRARTSIRRRKSASQPGSPPSAHGDDLKTRIEFDYDFKTKGVVVGPVKLNKVQFATSLFAQTSVPYTLEKGGPGLRVETRLAGPITETEWRRADYRRNETKHAISLFRETGRKQVTLNLQERGGPPVFVGFRVVRTQIAARPFMDPALIAERPKFPGLFANSIT